MLAAFRKAEHRRQLRSIVSRHHSDPWQLRHDVVSFRFAEVEA